MGQAFRNIWNTTISGAVLCNKLIATLENNKESMSEKVFAQYVGELEVMRSYYYYMLFDCFGRIPYQEKFESDTEPLMAPEKVWSRLVDCLEKNAPNLPVVTDANRALNYGTPLPQRRVLRMHPFQHRPDQHRRQQDQFRRRLLYQCRTLLRRHHRRRLLQH